MLMIAKPGEPGTPPTDGIPPGGSRTRQRHLRSVNVVSVKSNMQVD
jgi:hypothetical protein